ncbi:MAG: hypothetical protein K8F32_08550 [Rhodocyclaceae bacterium]|nr:hypothetical protein [Rhodocyclaceae bacterium]
MTLRPNKTNFLRAARLMRLYAEALRSCEAVGGKWPENDPGAKAEYNELKALERMLRNHANMLSKG